MPGVYLFSGRPGKKPGAKLFKTPANAVTIASIAAGGPGSGRRPYGHLKPILSDDNARKLVHPTWIRHFNLKKQAYGGVIVDGHGRFLLREPTGHFDGYVWTWPKGKMDSKDEHPVDVATREVAQETGLKAGIIGQLPYTYTTHSGSFSSFYVMRPTGFDPSQMDNETARTKWATYEEAKKLINQTENGSGRRRDLSILEVAHHHLSKGKYSLSAAGEWNEELHPRDDHGKFAPNPATGIVDKQAVIKGLQQMGWTKQAKMAPLRYPFQGKFIKSPKIILTHPQHGTIGLGSEMFYHIPKGGAGTHTSGNYQTELAQHVNKLASTPQPMPQTGGVVNPTKDPLGYESIHEQHPEIFGDPTGALKKAADEAVKETVQKLSPPAGMSDHYEGEWYSYHFNPSSGKYDMTWKGTGEIAHENLPPSDVQHQHDAGVIKPSKGPDYEEWKPTQEPAHPTNMAVHYMDDNGTSAHWNQFTQKYDLIDKDGKPLGSVKPNVLKYSVEHNEANIKPYEPGAPLPKFDKPQKTPPEGMAEHYVDNNGNSAKWNHSTGKYDVTSPKGQHVEKSADVVKDIADKGIATAVTELAAKAGLLPADLNNIMDNIDNWKGSTTTTGAAYIRAASQDVIHADPEAVKAAGLEPTKELKSRYSAALQIEHEVTKAKLAQLYPGGTMKLYRGLTGEVATALNKAKSTGQLIEYHMMGAEGFSDSKLGFGSGGAYIDIDAPLANIITSYKTTPKAQTSYYSEKETFVAFPNKVAYLKPHNIIKGAAVKLVAGMGKQPVKVDGTKDMGMGYAQDPAKLGNIPPDQRELQFDVCDKNGRPIRKKK